MTDGVKQWSDEDGTHFDLRGMTPPEPIIEIVRIIAAGTHAAGFLIHVPHFPVHLLVELENRDWGWARVAESPGETVLKLFPRKAS